jgi:ribosome-associated protein
MSAFSVAWDQEWQFIRHNTSSVPNLIPSSIPDSPWLTAARAADSKKATDIRILDLRDVTSFADYFLICTGGNSRQIQAISQEIREQLAERGENPVSVEGFENADWVLVDYGDYLVHVFSPKARAYYDLERLWKHAREVPVPALA